MPQCYVISCTLEWSILERKLYESIIIVITRAKCYMKCGSKPLDQLLQVDSGKISIEMSQELCIQCVAHSIL